MPFDSLPWLAAEAQELAAFVAGLRRDRDQIRAFDLENPGYRVVHDNLSDMAQVTTGAGTYRKGAWTLHMLRGVVGDEAFWSGIREYYRLYRDKNASTADFRRVMEEASGRELGWFLDQWLHRGGMLKVGGRWRWDAATRVPRQMPSIRLRSSCAPLQRVSGKTPGPGAFHFPKGSPREKTRP